MPRDIPVGNGRLLVTFDEQYRIRDIYFPHVGKENHSEGHPFRFGVWADGQFSWVGDDGWVRELRYLPETLVTDVRLVNAALGLEILSSDAVDFHENIFLRRLLVRDLRRAARREVRLFFHHDFYISESEVGDTAYFDPETRSLIHYKGQRYFLISTDAAEGVETFATGRKAFRGQEGTWRDAEDGVLSNHAITEGSVDSTVGRALTIEAGSSAETFYWIAVGTNRAEVARLNTMLRTGRGPAAFIKRTADYWRAWVNKNEIDFGTLPAGVVELFKRSLLVVRTQVDAGGAIIAANDSDVVLRATDHYSYLWPRDGALVAYALDAAGYSNLTRTFFDLCGRIVTEKGYFLQRYNPDGSLASSWHAWWDARRKEELLPIQEDETALVLWALWHHYDEFRDIEFIRPIYRPLIVRAAEFLANYRNPATGLPRPSWNLWEDRLGVHTFTCATVVGGLLAAAKFAALFGETASASYYETAAEEVRAGMRAHLFRPELGRFARMAFVREDGSPGFDTTVDASLFGVFYFGAFAPEDEMVRSTMRAVEERLWVKTAVGGVARYEADGYLRTVGDDARVPGNPWFICTLWLADYAIATAREPRDLERALEILEWVGARSLPSGVLAEQVDPLTGAPLSVSPLTWSHASYVATVMAYLRKLSACGPCAACGRPLFQHDRRARAKKV